MIIDILLGVGALAIAIVLHELGHFFYLIFFTPHWEYTLRFNFEFKRFGWLYNRTLLNDKQEMLLQLSGIFPGLIFLLLVSLFSTLNVILIIVTIFYLIGCHGDVERFLIAFGGKK